MKEIHDCVIHLNLFCLILSLCCENYKKWALWRHKWPKVAYLGSLEHLIPIMICSLTPPVISGDLS